MRITAREDHCLRGSLSARIAERTTITAASVGLQEDTERVCVPALVVTLGSVLEKQCTGPCVAMLCGCGYGTWMLQGDRTAFIFAASKFAAREVQSEAKRSRKRKRTE